MPSCPSLVSLPVEVLAIVLRHASSAPGLTPLATVIRKRALMSVCAALAQAGRLYGQNRAYVGSMSELESLQRAVTGPDAVKERLCALYVECEPGPDEGRPTASAIVSIVGACAALRLLDVRWPIAGPTFFFGGVVCRIVAAASAPKSLRALVLPLWPMDAPDIAACVRQCPSLDRLEIRGVRMRRAGERWSIWVVALHVVTQRKLLPFQLVKLLSPSIDFLSVYPPVSPRRTALHDLVRDLPEVRGLELALIGGDPIDVADVSHALTALRPVEYLRLQLIGYPAAVLLVALDLPADVVVLDFGHLDFRHVLALLLAQSSKPSPQLRLVDPRHAVDCGRPWTVDERDEVQQAAHGAGIALSYEDHDYSTVCALAIL